MTRSDGMYSTSREKRRSKIRERKIVLFIDPITKKGTSSSSASALTSSSASLAVDSSRGIGDGSVAVEGMTGDDGNGLSAAVAAALVDDDMDETSNILDGDWNRYILTEEEQKKR